MRTKLTTIGVVTIVFFTFVAQGSTTWSSKYSGKSCVPMSTVSGSAITGGYGHNLGIYWTGTINCPITLTSESQTGKITQVFMYGDANSTARANCYISSMNSAADSGWTYAADSESALSTFSYFAFSTDRQIGSSDYAVLTCVASSGQTASMHSYLVYWEASI